MVRKFVRRPQLLPYLPKCGGEIGFLRIKMRASCLARDASHDAGSVTVSRRFTPMSILGVAQSEDQGIRCLCSLNGFHHVMRTGIVFPVAEDQQRPTPTLRLYQLIGDGIVDRVVEGSPKNTFLDRTKLGKVPLALLIALQGIDQKIACRREIAHQSQVVAETDQKSAVSWSQNLLEKNLKVLVVLLQEMLLTAAEVHDQPEGQGNIRTARKESNRLRHRILENLKIILGQIVDQGSAGIAHRECDVDQVHVHSNRLLCLVYVHPDL